MVPCAIKGQHGPLGELVAEVVPTPRGKGRFEHGAGGGSRGLSSDRQWSGQWWGGLQTGLESVGEMPGPLEAMLRSLSES